MKNNNQTRTLAFQKYERNIFFHILTACNLSCRHCYINKDQHGHKTLKAQEIADWLKIFYLKERKSNVIFLGGEPTLHPDLPFAVKTAKEIGYNSVTIDTNGFLHNDLLAKIKPVDAVLSFSLDGPNPKINDSLRGDGVFKICTENIKKAVKAGFEVSVIYTVSSLNYKHLEFIPDLLADLGVKHFFIQIIGLRGNSAVKTGVNYENGLQIRMKDWLDTVPKAARKAADLGLHVIYPKVFLDEDEPFDCAGKLQNNYFVFPNGRVYMCPLCEDFPVNTFMIEQGKLCKNPGMVEDKFFSLDIPEGCVMNKMLQPASIEYLSDGKPKHRISCCLLKQELRPA